MAREKVGEDMASTRRSRPESERHGRLSPDTSPFAEGAEGQLTGNGQPTSVTAPTQVAPGDSLVLNEIIVLQLDVTIGVEFYPTCTQSRVGGSQTGNLIQAFLVHPWSTRVEPRFARRTARRRRPR